MRDNVLLLIFRYQAAVQAAVGSLRRALETDDVLAAARLDRRLREGELADGGHYAFHGIGCRVVLDGATVDFDFGKAGRFDGFDAWRLNEFAHERGPGFAVDLTTIEVELAELRSIGLIEAGEEPAGHLYYLTDAGVRRVRAVASLQRN